jgi:hypothetical protein
MRDRRHEGLPWSTPWWLCAMSSASNENDSPDPLIHNECQMLSLGTLGYGLAPEGCLKYYVEPRLPFDDGTGRWADFLVEANGSASDSLAISLRGTETKASCRAALVELHLKVQFRPVVKCSSTPTPKDRRSL